METRKERMRREKLEAFHGGFKILEGAAIPDDLPVNYLLKLRTTAIEHRGRGATEPSTVIDEAYRDQAMKRSFDSILDLTVIGYEYQEYREEFIVHLSDGTGIECTGIDGLHVSRMSSEQLDARAAQYASRQ